MINSELYYEILQKKYNILKKNLIIIEQTEEKINEFKDTIIKLDEIEQNKFKKDLEPKKELTTNLEDEYKRLCDYINLVQSRQRRRNNMLDDCYNIVKEKIDDLELIEGLDDIEFYNKRLEDINEFFENDDKYSKLSSEKNEILNNLEKYNEEKSNLCDILNEFEISLLVKLKSSIEKNDIYNKLDFDNVDENINEADLNVIDKEKELNTYLNSYNALIENNIEEVEKNEYLEFINELKKEYLEVLEKKYILLLYKYINDNKNEEALEVYKERSDKLKKYELVDNTDLKDIFEIIQNYMDKKLTLNEINEKIKDSNESIDELDAKTKTITEVLNKPDIVNLLKEFCIEKEYIVNNKDEGKNLKLGEISPDEKPELKIMFDTNFINEDELKSSFDEEKKEIEIFEKEDVVDLEEIEQIINKEEQSNILEEKKDVKEEVEDLDDETKDFDRTLEFKDNIFDDDLLNNESNELIESKFDNELVLEEVNKKESINKDNMVKLIKDTESKFNIDKAVNKAMKIMKSVCESVI